MDREWCGGASWLRCRSRSGRTLRQCCSFQESDRPLAVKAAQPSGVNANKASADRLARSQTAAIEPKTRVAVSRQTAAALRQGSRRSARIGLQLSIAGMAPCKLLIIPCAQILTSLPHQLKPSGQMPPLCPRGRSRVVVPERRPIRVVGQSRGRPSGARKLRRIPSSLRRALPSDQVDECKEIIVFSVSC